MHKYSQPDCFKQGHSQNGYVQKGIALMEILITVLVMSIGLLGLASLMTNGMKFNQSAYLRSQATVLAYSITDRMRANKDGFDAGDYNNATGAQKTNCTNTTGCNAADMAVHDTWDWNQNLGATLPSGQGVVCLDSTPDDGITTAIACDGSGSIYAVKVWWDDDRTGTAADFQRFVTSFRP